MCGIVGLITSGKNGFHYNENNALRDMMYADTLRGFDATGLMYGTNSGAVQIHKEASPGYRFLTSKEWDSSKTELYTRGKWAVGHNRAATRGDKTADKNAHPFIVDDKIILVQNGTYKGSHKHLKDTEVDTEACAHVLSDEKDISKALKSINAAYVFVWYNFEDKTLNIVRNDERPLYVAEAKNGSVFFASEGGILDFALNRNNIDLHLGPYLLADSHLLSYKMNGNEATETYEKIDIEYVPRKEDSAPFQTMDGSTTVISTGIHRLTNLMASGKPRVPFQRGVTTPTNSVLSLPQAMMSLNAAYMPIRRLDHLNVLQETLTDNRQRYFTIEGQDYVKINEGDPNDGHYFIFGTILEPEHELNGELVVWEVDHQGGTATEQELMRYVVDGFFKAKLNYMVRRPWGSSGWCTAFYLNDGVELVGSRTADVQEH